MEDVSTFLFHFNHQFQQVMLIRFEKLMVRY